MAETNLYKLLSGLYTAASNINTKVGNKNNQNGSAFEQLTALSTAVNGKFTPRLANGTSGLVYSGGDVTIAAGVITLNNEVVDTAELVNSAVKTAKIADKNVTSAKLADDVNTKIGHGETAYGKVSGANGEWHKHDNMATLSGISSTKVSNWDDANSKKHTHANLSVLSGIKDTDITNWNNGALVSAVVLEKTTTTDGYAATYQLKVNGSFVGSKIDILKDQFLKSGSLVKGTWSTGTTGTTPTFTPNASGTQYALALELYVRSDSGAGSPTTTTVYIDVRNLVDVYTGSNGIKVDGYVISLSGIPSNISITSSQLPTIPSSKLADASTYQTAVTQASNWASTSGSVVKTSDNLVKDHIVLGNNGDKTVKNSNYTVVSASGNFGANTLATAPAITGYIAAQGFQKSASMTNYVTAAANLEAETIVMGAGGKAVASGKKIVSTSGDIAATSGAAMIPTAGAVSSYVANKTTGMVTGTGLTADKLVAGNNGGAVKITSIATGDVVTAAANLTSGKLVVAAGNNKAISGTSYGVNTASGSVGAANQISTDDALTGYFASKNENFVSASDDLTSGQIILGNNDKTVKQSGLTVGTTSGSIGTTSTASTTIPRSDAVSSYVANKTANMVTAGAALTTNNLIVGNGSKGVTATSIAAANVVTATANFDANDIVIGVNNTTKAVQKSGYSITSGAADVTSGATAKVPTASAVKSYVDAQDTAAKNYLLNGNAGTSTGVTEWAGGDTTVGSLAELNKKVNALLTSIK